MAEVKALSKNKNVSPGLATQAKNMVEKKGGNGVRAPASKPEG